MRKVDAQVVEHEQHRVVGYRSPQRRTLAGRPAQMEGIGLLRERAASERQADEPGNEAAARDRHGHELSTPSLNERCKTFIRTDRIVPALDLIVLGAAAGALTAPANRSSLHQSHRR